MTLEPGRERRRYLAVEGPTGVGKTTLAECLEARLGWRLLRDPYGANPFLGDYYAQPASVAWTPLLVESAFVFLRLGQLRDARDTARPHLLSDYTFARTNIYAELLPDREDAERLKQLVAMWTPDVPHPDTIVSLSASFATLKSRIRLRGRNLERPMTDDHLRDLQRLYASWDWGPDVTVVEVATDAWDPRQRSDLDFLIGKLHVSTRRMDG